MELVYKDRRQTFHATIFLPETEAVAVVPKISVDLPTDGGWLAPLSEDSHQDGVTLDTAAWPLQKNDTYDLRRAVSFFLKDTEIWLAQG